MQQKDVDGTKSIVAVKSTIMFKLVLSTYITVALHDLY